jgi:hypothetical protein
MVAAPIVVPLSSFCNEKSIHPDKKAATRCLPLADTGFVLFV